jgi:hypothetical protein
VTEPAPPGTGLSRIPKELVRDELTRGADAAGAAGAVILAR